MMTSHLTGISELYASPIGCFCIPMFFFLSGVVFERALEIPQKDLIIKTLKSLIIPFILIALICSIFESIIGNDINRFFNTFTAIILNKKMTNAWFIPTLIIVEIAYHIFYNKVDRSYANTMSIVLMVVGFLYAKIFGLNGTLLWNLDTAFIGIGYFSLGNIYRERSAKKPVKALKSLSMILVCIVICIFNTVYTDSAFRLCMFNSEYGIFAIYIAASLFGILGVIGIAKLIGTNDTLEWLGRNTLYISSLHLTLFCFVEWLYFDFFLFLYSESIVAFWVIEYLLMIVLSSIFNSLLKKIQMFICKFAKL